MHIRLIGLALCVLALLRCELIRAATTTQPDNVSILLDQWNNPDRGDEPMPVKIYYPKTGDGPFPVIIVSHGLGGSREGLRYEGEYWAAHGYVSIHLQHVGSDDSVWKNAAQGEEMKQLVAAMTPEQFMNRVGDVKFALDHLADVNKDAASPLHGKLDLDRIAMAGHSFGAITTQAMCGEVFNTDGHKRTFGDPRIKAGIIFSPSPPTHGDAKAAFAKINIPMFHWTGTKDEVGIGAKADVRRVPFDSMNGSDQFLVVLTDADHMIFNGRPHENPLTHPNDAAWKDLIERGTTAFLDAYLKGDDKAKHFLVDGEFASQVKAYGTFEEKMKK